MLPERINTNLEMILLFLTNIPSKLKPMVKVQAKDEIRILYKFYLTSVIYKYGNWITVEGCIIMVNENRRIYTIPYWKLLNIIAEDNN